MPKDQEVQLLEDNDRSVGFGEAEEKRVIATVQAQVIMAKKFPRDLIQVRTNIIEACKNKKLAEKSFYLYTRGNTNIMGASIRLAEVLQRHYQNIQSGVKEVSRQKDYSDVMSFSWDLENNVFDAREFTVTHYRYTKKKGNVLITDPRDIYEHIANMGARRKRACILSVIPFELQDEAVETCQKVLSAEIKGSKTERIKKMLDLFAGYNVTQQMIELKYGIKLKDFSDVHFTELIGIYNSLKDNVQRRESFFEIPGGEQTSEEKEADEKIKSREKSKETEPE